MLQKFYSAAALLEQVKEGQRFYLVKSQTETLGFVALSSQEDLSVFINKFYLKIGEQNKGYGEHVFDLIKEKHPHSKLTLTVNRQNYKAINFYFKLGFKIQTVADFDIGNGYVMNDFVMVYEPLNE
jgi:ribosomal protein S18 acetylase RimI-like enzyme